MAYQKDHSFDKLIHRFKREVYKTAKGSWWLKLLREKLKTMRENPALLTAWDAGYGLRNVLGW